MTDEKNKNAQHYLESAKYTLKSIDNLETPFTLNSYMII